ncbi:unnamed protein product [Bursaphelenchus okinawaensis]|uniref:Solute carrier organic anion transporter family member n=1 Tax=Bursaphelenchus okinawaensis TaxID=465554 RepID=A0A811LLX8_9BILA|nr:unnamed protein product [Bursaphelenchus okinawaensis]CAG9126755.1 unnamed protein product [Bursaphelenchus okinawaensis]
MERIHVFLALFAFVCYLESTGSSYMISAVQNIERQFQIPSKLSGFLISAHDISYIPTVIFIAYFGSRGNRAKWIGAGTVVIAISYIFIASPNFIFPVPRPSLNTSTIEAQLKADGVLLSKKAEIRQFFEYAPLRDRIPGRYRQRIIDFLDGSGNEETSISYSNHTKSIYSFDEPLISEILAHMDGLLKKKETEADLIKSLQKFIQNRKKLKDEDLGTLRRAAIAPFSFCHKMVNDFRHVLKEVRCSAPVSNVGPLTVMFLALLAMGVGRTMPWSLGIPLIDDNVKNKSTPLMFAFMSFVKILGPICGFMIGSLVNRVYFTFPAAPPAGLTRADPTWIGAWWLGFLVIGIVLVLPSLMLYFFPESSGKNKVYKEGTKSEKLKLSFFDRHAKDEQLNIKKMVESYKVVLKCKVYTGTVAGRVMDILAIKGYMVFLPKYLENHFGIPQYQVHMYMAMFGVLGFACGTFCGGIIMKKLKLNGRSAAFYILVCSVFSTSMFLTKSFIGCHSVVNSIGQSGVETGFNYTRTCNRECGCESAKLFPVCDASGHPFYSPCHAGCRHVTVVDVDSHLLEFSECDCAPGGIVKKSYCRDDCRNMKYIFFATVVIGAFCAGTTVVPGMLILLRSVPPEMRSVSLGLQGFLVSFFGTLPSPLLWGAVIDSTCLIWDQVCGERGACIIYDPDQLRTRMHFLYCSIRMFSILIDFYVLYHAKGLNLMDESKKSNSTEVDAASEIAMKENIAMDAMAE